MADASGVPAGATSLPAVALAEIVAAVNHVLNQTRPAAEPVRANTRLAELGLESIDYVEIFIILEEATGAVFDLSQAPGNLETVADLARYQQLAVTGSTAGE